jgi:hypothetical protein
MADYLKAKEIEVKADQFSGPPLPAGVYELEDQAGVFYFSSPEEGAVPLIPGDWIVTDEHGRQFVLDAARFAALYKAKA